MLHFHAVNFFLNFYIALHGIDIKYQNSKVCIKCLAHSFHALEFGFGILCTENTQVEVLKIYIKIKK